MKRRREASQEEIEEHENKMTAYCEISCAALVREEPFRCGQEARESREKVFS